MQQKMLAAEACAEVRAWGRAIAPAIGARPRSRRQAHGAWTTGRAIGALPAQRGEAEYGSGSRISMYVPGSFSGAKPAFR